MNQKNKHPAFFIKMDSQRIKNGQPGRFIRAQQLPEQ
jgi:hypothetical protein